MFGRDSKKEYVFITLFLVAAGFIIFKLVSDKNYQESLEHFYGEGDSMAPTILDREEITSDPNQKAEEGDIIVFKCEKCKITGDDIDILTERLIEINQEGCFWVEGDNSLKSYDSRNFGWLCPGEIEYYGVVLDKD